jgi:hypothetical protein
MIVLTHETPILLGVATDHFRRGIDGFVELGKNELAQATKASYLCLSW